MTNYVEFPGLGLGFTINRIAFSIGNFNFYWYGLLIATGLLLGAVFAMRQAKRFGVDEDRMIDVIMLGTVGSIICARAYYVAFAPFKYQSFWDMINIRDGGIAIYGAVIGAFAVGALACKWRKVPLWPMFDLGAMGFLIGQAIGRWGNFVNQEAFGTNTTAPWGMISPQTTAYLASVQQSLAAEGVMVDPMMPVHPTFLYESIWCIVGFFALWAYIKHRKFDGEITLFYVIWYGLGRGWIEGLRTDSLYAASGFRMSQVLAIISAAAAFIVWLLLRRKYAKQPAVLAVDRVAAEKAAKEAKSATAAEQPAASEPQQPQQDEAASPEESEEQE